MSEIIINLSEDTSYDLMIVGERIGAELARRETLEAAEEKMENIVRDVLSAEGIVPGDPWRPVTGAHDAYPKDWEVTHSGKTWVSLRHGASGEPGVVSGDWQEKQEEGQIVDWVQPHAGAEYPELALVRHDGFVWRNDLGRPNGFKPGTPHSGWTKL